ncbi:hypothetical protein ACFQS1_10735 [Paractinoplanes rhizophilus]|jgi:hypothetical protein|uniref:DUF3040 domain-containing protein n=1 Tax=Paractinoplanes rhizophilus TaxID=1416877 RepID=A0ABW2HPH8_9ACTN|nr:hypothetical protein [Actinoplanes sp.]
MASRDTRQEFEDIVERLTTDYPSLARTGMPPFARPVLVTLLIVGGLAWALLSVAMVAWGWRGVVLTCAAVLGTVVALTVRTYRWRAGR